MTEQEKKSIAYSLAQLRHLYSHMVNGRVKDTEKAARGLLGPEITRLEHLLTGVEQDPLGEWKALAREYDKRRVK